LTRKRAPGRGGAGPSLFDLTHPLGPDAPVFPGEEPVTIRLISDVRSGQPYTARRFDLGSHSGTHVDAPAHLIADAPAIDALPLQVWTGEALLLDADGFPDADLRGVRRLLLGGCAAGIPPAWARTMVERRIALVGLDGPSADPLESSDLPSHRILLGAGIPIIENLRLDGVPRGRGILYCLPLSVQDGDGAPARVLWQRL
jgi:arylformamidase